MAREVSFPAPTQYVDSALPAQSGSL